MAEFVRCRGKAYCRENRQGCLTCGRSHHEIHTTRSLIAQATEFILEQHYDNADEFASYLAEKIAAKIRYTREKPEHSAAD
jgi:hypothetical protein